MGSYVSLANDTKDEAVAKLGADMLVIDWAVDEWTKWAKFVITGGGNMPLPNIGTGTGKGEDYYVLPDGAYYGEEGATPYEKAAQKFVVQANPSYSLLSNDAKGNIKVVAAVEGWDDLPDDAVEQEKKSTITKAAVQSVINKAFVHSLVKKFEDKDYKSYSPGQEIKSGKKSLSLLMEYTCVRFHIDSDTIQVLKAHHHVWSGKTNKSVNKYNMTSMGDWKTEATINIRCVGKNKKENGDHRTRAQVVETSARTVENPTAVRMSCCGFGSATKHGA